MNLVDIIVWVGKFCTAFYFLWSAYFNYITRDFHVQEFARIGVPQGRFVVFFGIIWTVVATLMFLIPSTTVLGGLMIIIFIIIADALFHRYWTYDNPQEVTIHKLFLFEHVALIGGILGLIAHHIYI